MIRVRFLLSAIAIYIGLIAASASPQSVSTTIANINPEINYRGNQIEHSASPDSTQGWISSIYVSYALGIPKGARGEFGYNFSSVSLGAMIGGGGDETIGLVGKLHLFELSSCRIYAMFGTGGTVSIFGGGSNYKLLFAGAQIPLLRWLQISPEAGWLFTESTNYGDWDPATNSFPESTETKSRFTCYISIEVDFAGLF